MDCESIAKRSRALTSLHNNTEKSPKSSELICLVCGATATGFNFSIITCMCCKAFFRRNALFGLGAYQCRYLTEKCIINMRTRRDCSYCRLKKCFQVGMKKELILTEDVKRLKRETIHANRQMTLILGNRTNLLSETDSTCLRNISNAYEGHCRSPIMTFEKHEYELVCQQPIKARIKFPRYVEFYKQHHIALDTFFKCLPELQQFSNDEQQLLITHNIRFLMRISTVETKDDLLPVWGAVNFLLETIYGKPIVEEVGQCLQDFKYQINDPRCIQLFLVLLFFSTFSNYTGHMSTLIVYKIQEKYTQLLWIYLKQRYGERNACKKVSLLIRYCLRLQTISHYFEATKQDVQWQEFFVPIN